MSAENPVPAGRDGGDAHREETPDNGPAPLPSTSTPLTFACSCLNVTVAARVSDALQKRLEGGDGGEELEAVWLPEGAETIVHREMATFVRDDEVSGKEEAWRKCWVCGVKVYRAKERYQADMAPVDEWVEVDFGSGVVYGNKYDETVEKPPLPYSGLRIDLPTTSTFGRPPRDSTPVPYPSRGGNAAAKLLPPVPDPFFLPPPFIPSNPVLRDMCATAVEKVYAVHEEIQRDIAEYIAKRTGDMLRLEDQVRAEVESLWTRYSEGPGAGEVSAQRRDSLNRAASRDRSRSPAVAKPGDRKAVDSSSNGRKPAVPTTDLTRPSGVTISPPRFAGQYNAHTAAAAASLLSASLSANAFHAPPSSRSTAGTDAELAELTKTMSNDGVPHEVAMSYAFSAMDEHMAIAGGKKVHKHEEKVAETVEEEQEERDKGIDSWINMERAQAAHGKEKKEDEAKERKSKVTFSEPFKGRDGEKAVVEEEVDVDELANGADDEPVFDFETDTPTAPHASSPVPSGARRRTLVEDNLSHAFAADAPSHRAAWRQWEARESMSTALRRQSSDDEDDLEDTPDTLARSVPVNIVRPPRSAHPVQYKTSLTDRGGVIVPHLLAAMRRDDGDRARGSISIRRGSRTISTDRERDQIKSYAADPGAVFESLEGAVSDSESEEETPQNGRFIPPHVLAAKRDDKAEPGWRSLAT